MLSKLFALAIKPSNLIVFFVVLSGALWLLGLHRGSRLMLRGALVALVTFAILPIGNWLITPLENRFARTTPAAVDGIILLSGAVNKPISNSRGTLSFTGAAERYFVTAVLAQHYPDARVVITGGDSGLIAAEPHGRPAVQRLLKQLGLDGSRLEFERQSRNTHENAVFTNEMIGPRAGETWMLVTSAYHMPRAMGVFRALGWELVPYPVDYRSTNEYTLGLHVYLSVGGRLAKLDLAVTEWIALIVYRLLGRTESLLPNGSG